MLPLWFTIETSVSCGVQSIKTTIKKVRQQKSRVKPQLIAFLIQKDSYTMNKFRMVKQSMMYFILMYWNGLLPVYVQWSQSTRNLGVGVCYTIMGSYRSYYSTVFGKISNYIYFNHPPNSTDLVPADFFPFSKVKLHMKGTFLKISSILKPFLSKSMGMVANHFINVLPTA